MELSTKKAAGVDEEEPEGPTIKYRGVRAMPFVIGNETFEKLGTIGTSSNLLVYLTTIFNMKSVTAANLINVFHGTANFATMAGAFICDTYFGRYKTLGFASFASFLGMLLITLTAAIPMLHPPHCNAAKCKGPTTWQMAFLLSGLGLLVVGAGGIRPCNLAFGADQFDPRTESGKRGINSFFNWYYFTFTFAMMVSLTLIVYVQSDISWALGLAIPTILMFFSCVMFFMGSRIYVKIEPEGSPLKSVAQVIVAAIRKRRITLPERPSLHLHDHILANSVKCTLPHTDQFRFLDKSAIITCEDQIVGSVTDPWRLCSVQQVEEVKCFIRVIPIWASSIIYYVALAQQQTYAVLQAIQSNRRLGTTNFNIPAASYTVFSMIAITFWIPFFDRILVPLLQRLTGKEGGITTLTKMASGMVISILTMIISALVEEQRRTLALEKPILGVGSRRGVVSSMSGLWLIPQLTLVGISEALTIIGHVEFYYKEFPENMRSIGGSLTFVGFALGSYMTSLLVSLVHQKTQGTATGNWLSEDLNSGRLDYFYYLVSALGVINLCYFLVCAKWYRYKGSSHSILQESTY